VGTGLKFWLQDDGNLTIKDSALKTIWASNTNSLGVAGGPYTLNLQSDHNLVLRDKNGISIWSTKTQTLGAAATTYGARIKAHVDLKKNSCCMAAYKMPYYNTPPYSIYHLTFNYCDTKYGEFTCPPTVLSTDLIDHTVIEAP